MALAAGSPALAQTRQWVGGQGAEGWAGLAQMSVMVDTEAAPGAMQPFELDPEENVVQRLGRWFYWKFPIDPEYRPMLPRIWRAVNWTVTTTGDPRPFVDGDPKTFTVYFEWGWRDLDHEFDTLDFGAPLPLERFVFYPPEGTSPLNDEPYRPNFVLRKFELSGGSDPVAIQREGGEAYQPLEVLLARVDNNFSSVTEVRFRTQYLRFLRFKSFGEGLGFAQYLKQMAIAEMEVYGRGFAPEATFLSKAIDLGEETNLGRVRLAGIRLRKVDGGDEEPAPGSAASVSVELRTGRDDSPTAFFGYNDQGEHSEVTETAWAGLRPRVYPWDPPAVGWRGPLADDTAQWSFWSAPLRTSGLRPGLPPGRYFQVRVSFHSQELWEFARLESLAVELLPLLADRVVAEVALPGDLDPAGGVSQVLLGQQTELIWAMRAEFSTAGRAGFDAVRILTPAPTEFVSLEIGDPPRLATPDSVRPAEGSIAVYLPQVVDRADILRIRLRTSLFSGSTTLTGSVFDRREQEAGQPVDEGDAVPEIGTDRLRLVAADFGRRQAVLGDVAVRPAVTTANGDGIGDRSVISYALFGVTRTQVRVKVLDLSGRPVFAVSQEQSSGRHEVSWDGRDANGKLVQPGTYLCRIEADSEHGVAVFHKILAIAY